MRIIFQNKLKSNVIIFRRSRRKGVNERCRLTRHMSSSGGKNATTCIHAPNCKRKALSEMGVCDSFDDEVSVVSLHNSDIISSIVNI